MPPIPPVRTFTAGIAPPGTPLILPRIPPIRGPLPALAASLIALASAACFNPSGMPGSTTDPIDSETAGPTDSDGPTPTPTTGPGSLTSDEVLTTSSTTDVTTPTTGEVTTEPATTLASETTGSESGSTRRSFCGDSIVDPGEDCDDGNHSNGDGCQHNCMFPGCGDGAFDRGELCDDGNLIDNDGCSSTCVRDAAFVFVSSALYPSDLGGPFGGDNLCQGLATDAGLPGLYQAWLSIDILAAPDHITELPLPYIRPDGVLVADSFAALVEGMPAKLKASISVTETGEALKLDRQTCLSGPPVWTGTDETGLAVPAGNCNGWETPEAIDPATAGKATATDGSWTRGCTLKCADMAHLYCFEAM